MPTTDYEPGTTIDLSGTPGEPGTAHSTSVKPGLLVSPSRGTYYNGFEVTGAAYGDSNTNEAFIYQVEIPGIHPQNQTVPYDKTSAYAAGDPITVKRHKLGNVYWLKGSSLTVTDGDKLITTTAGLVIAQTAHTATPLPHCTWAPVKSFTSATWVKAMYLGITSMFTA